MNNFSDLLAIDQLIEVQLRIRPIMDNGAPHGRVKINQTVLFDDPVKECLDLSHKVHLQESILLKISMSEKIYCAEKETALIIEYVLIDGLEVMPKLEHLAVHHNEKNHTVPTCYLGFNGIWSLHITEPFYRWYHRATAQGWLLEP
jgi:hypothetical protein